MVSELGFSSSQDAATAKISGRYPETGFALNRESDMVLRITHGIGIIATRESSEQVGEGDVLFIDKQTPYFYEGDFEVLMVSSPPWSPEQYEHIDD
ncbi:MAG: hypothetical protein V4678_04170 [Patescibacteria group bacterium]